MCNKWSHMQSVIDYIVKAARGGLQACCGGLQAMRRALAAFLLAGACIALNAEVTYDAARHSVTFTAASTDCGVDAQLEFLFVGPSSDRAYEAMFVTDDPISEIVAAFDKAGIPFGKALDPSRCRIWPVGKRLHIEPDFKTFVEDHMNAPLPPIVFAGGLKDAKGEHLAFTQMPQALFALYSCPQSPILFDDSMEQSATYGRFTPLVKIPKGEKRTFTFSWKGGEDYVSKTLKLAKGSAAKEAIKNLILEAKEAKLSFDVLCDFAPDMTLKEAIDAANALQLIDSPKVKINGFKGSQLFYKAFLPQVKWRDRKERLAQPPEVRFCTNGTFSVTQVLEDWSDEDSLDPKLSLKTAEYADISVAAIEAMKLVGKTSTMFFYAKDDTPLGRLYDFRSKLPHEGLNIYVFDE